MGREIPANDRPTSFLGDPTPDWLRDPSWPDMSSSEDEDKKEANQEWKHRYRHRENQTQKKYVSSTTSSDDEDDDAPPGTLRNLRTPWGPSPVQITRQGLPSLRHSAYATAVRTNKDTDVDQTSDGDGGNEEKDVPWYQEAVNELTANESERRQKEFDRARTQAESDSRRLREAALKNAMDEEKDRRRARLQHKVNLNDNRNTAQTTGNGLLEGRLQVTDGGSKVFHKHEESKELKEAANNSLFGSGTLFTRSRAQKQFADARGSASLEDILQIGGSIRHGELCVPLTPLTSRGDDDGSNYNNPYGLYTLRSGQEGSNMDATEAQYADYHNNFVPGRGLPSRPQMEPQAGGSGSGSGSGNHKLNPLSPMSANSTVLGNLSSSSSSGQGYGDMSMSFADTPENLLSDRTASTTQYFKRAHRGVDRSGHGAHSQTMAATTPNASNSVIAGQQRRIQFPNSVPGLGSSSSTAGALDRGRSLEIPLGRFSGRERSPPMRPRTRNCNNLASSQSVGGNGNGMGNMEGERSSRRRIRVNEARAESLVPEEEESSHDNPDPRRRSRSPRAVTGTRANSSGGNGYMPPRITSRNVLRSPTSTSSMANPADSGGIGATTNFRDGPLARHVLSPRTGVTTDCLARMSGIFNARSRWNQERRMAPGLDELIERFGSDADTFLGTNDTAEEDDEDADN